MVTHSKIVDPLYILHDLDLFKHYVSDKYSTFNFIKHIHEHF
jgi:hypothetical protein